MTETALFVKNHYGSPESIIPQFRKAGIKTRLVYSFDRAAMAKVDPLAFDYAVYFGGPQGAHQTGDYAYIRPVMDIMRARHMAGLPNLGFCLGAQELAVALGGESIRGEGGKFSELGWMALDVNAAGRASPVRHFDSGATGSRVLESHDDTFKLPPGATLLASTAKCANQAFSLGASLGLQFHPEVTRRGLLNMEACLAKAAGSGAVKLDEVRAANREFAGSGMRQTAKFVTDYLAQNRPLAAAARLRQG